MGRVTLLVAFSVVTAALFIACGSLPADPPTGSSPVPSAGSGTTDVQVSVVDGVVDLQPQTVPAGSVRFLVEDADDATEHSGFEFMSRGLACPPCTNPDPLVAGDIELLRADSAPQGFANDGGWGAGIVLTLRPGIYAFMVAGPQGGQPGVPPLSITPLTVTP